MKESSGLMLLTTDQTTALVGLEEFLSNNDKLLACLSGSAGTGKTTLTRHLVKSARSMGLQSLCVAPTHKARKVLHAAINSNQTFIRTPTTTVAGLLGKGRAHSYIGTQNYTGQNSKIDQYDFIVIDEVSMVSNEDYQTITELSHRLHKKVLFVGDDQQISNPTQSMVKCLDKERSCSYLIKRGSPAFSLECHYHLSETVRTGADNPLLSFYQRVRECIGHDIDLKTCAIGCPSVFLDTPLELDGFKLGQNRIICYTNAAVRAYNTQIRRQMGYIKKLVVGEVLMGWNNVGTIIENGQDYIIQELNYVKDHSISFEENMEWKNLVGWLATIKEIYENGEPPVKVFLPDMDEDNNADVLNHLIELAHHVNKPHSKKMDYIRYKALKDQLIFMENIFTLNGRNITETEAKNSHYLLLNSSKSIIDGNEPEKRAQIEHQYPGLLAKRIADNKCLTDNEKLIDMYQVLEKDMDYGYAITAHKSQGSTYNKVYIDEENFNVMQDGWSQRQNCVIRRTTERDQLKYVAITRARNSVHLWGNLGSPIPPPMIL
jgi:thymidine kinase